MKKLLLTVAIVSIFLVGCSKKSPEESKKAVAQFPLPQTVGEIKSNTSYKLYHTGEKTGVQYYIKEISNEELGKYSYDDPVRQHIITGPEKSRVYIPVKDDQIVEIDSNLMGDIIAIGMKVSFEDQEAKK